MRPAGRARNQSVGLTDWWCKRQMAAAAGTLRREWIGLQFLHGGSAPGAQGKTVLGSSSLHFLYERMTCRMSGDEARFWAGCGRVLEYAINLSNIRKSNVCCHFANRR
jgi:hypothetical protein